MRETRGNRDEVKSRDYRTKLLATAALTGA